MRKPSSPFALPPGGSRVGTWLRVLVALVGAITISALILWFSKVLIADPLIKRGLRVFPLKQTEEGAMETLKVRTPECDLMEGLVKTTIQESRQCETDADCATISLGCPFGCATAIRDELYSDIGNLNREFQSRCGYCLSGCTTDPPASVCRRGSCTLDMRPGAPPPIG